jgi:serine/threonine-protein kinase
LPVVADAQAPRQVGRYLLFDEIASGGMATVHFGRLIGPEGFSRTVAIKRLHPHYAKDPEFVAMLLDEARLVARIRHPSVVPTIDILTDAGEILIVMEYVSGASLSRLARDLRAAKQPIPVGIGAAIVGGVLAGLHAAHEATSEQGTPLDIVHRDVSPQNVLVGSDGASRIIDFGIAKAVGRLQTTREGQVKGKVRYMSPEQIRGRQVDRRSDVYAAGVVLWESLTGESLFVGDDPVAIMNQVLEKSVPCPSEVHAAVPKELDAVVMKALSRAREDRWATAQDMLIALESAAPMRSTREVGAWVTGMAGDWLKLASARVRDIEASSTSGKVALDPASQRSDVLVPAVAEAATAHAHVTEITDGPRPVRRWTLAVAASLGAITLGAMVLGGRDRVLPAPTVRAPPAAVSPGPVSPEGSAAPVASPSPAPAVSSASPVQPSVRSPVVVPSPARHAVPSKPKARCDPPYTIDTSGVRHWIDGC